MGRSESMKKFCWNEPLYGPNRSKVSSLSLRSIHYNSSSVSPHSGQLAARTRSWLFLIYPSHSPRCGVEPLEDVSEWEEPELMSWELLACWLLRSRAKSRASGGTFKSPHSPAPSGRREVYRNDTHSAGSLLGELWQVIHFYHNTTLWFTKGRCDW